MRGEAGRRRTDPRYGRGSAAIEDDDYVLLDVEEIKRRLLAVFSAPGYRPPTLPSVATQLMALSQRADVHLDDVLALLEQDAMLTGGVLRIARSPVYLRGAATDSIRGAVMRMGLHTLRDIVLEACMNLRVFRASGFMDAMERLRRHSIATGHVARIVCRHTRIEGDLAFLCGLLHDVGIAGCLISLSERRSGAKAPDLVSLWPAIDGAHAEAGALMTKLWELPAEVQSTVASHHQVWVKGAAHPLAAAICVADSIARDLGRGIVARDGGAVVEVGGLEAACLRSFTAIDATPPRTLEHAREVLGLDDVLWRQIGEEAGSLLEGLP